MKENQGFDDGLNHKATPHSRNDIPDSLKDYFIMA